MTKEITFTSGGLKAVSLLDELCERAEKVYSEPKVTDEWYERLFGIERRIDVNAIGHMIEAVKKLIVDEGEIIFVNRSACNIKIAAIFTRDGNWFSLWIADQGSKGWFINVRRESDKTRADRSLTMMENLREERGA